MNSFDENLWTRLVDEHDAHLVQLGTSSTQTSRWPFVLGTGAAVAAAAAAAIVFGVSATTSAPPAYALTQNRDGTVSVTIHELANAIPQLNAKFAQMGIDETVVPVEASCTQDPRFRMTAYPQLKTTDTWTFTPGRSELAPGTTGVLAAEQLPNGEVAIWQGAVTPPVPSCFSNVAYTPPQLTGATTNGVPMVTRTAINPATKTKPGR